MVSDIDTFDSGLSTPFSTGGGGVTFEQLVGTSYLVSLLAGYPPRGLDWGVTKEVKFQHRWEGCLLDDIVVTSTDGSEERKLALQIKHKLTFSDAPKNETFARVIDDCWKTFNGSLGWKFNQPKDRIGIGIGIYQSELAEHFQPLLDWARTSKHSGEFLRKVSLPKFSSKEKRDYLTVIRNLLDKAKGTAVTDDELWQFFRCLVVLHFDIETPGSRDSVYCWNCLLEQLKNGDYEQAKLLFGFLTSVVAEYARSAGCISLDVLKSKIPNSIGLKEQTSYTFDLNRLREHTDRVLDSISITIGNKVHLPRTNLLDKIIASVRESEVVVIAGEPMLGKSGLLKLLANRLRCEGEIIALSVERLFGSSIENFLHGIHVQNNFQSILSAIGTAPLRCLLIDGLERAVDDDKRRILNDFIIEVRKYNESVIKSGGNKEYCWKIVFTCRIQEALNILLHLETQRNLLNQTLRFVEVNSLTDDEVEEVVSQLPKLKDLASRGHLKEILTRPLILDILTLPEISLPPEEVPKILTETWLLDWFWKEVVRLAEGARTGKGNPDKREQLLIHIAKESIRTNKPVEFSENLDEEALSGLASDRLLVREDSYIRYAHDVLEDWTLTILLRQNRHDIAGFLKQYDETLYLVGAFRLYAARLLEVNITPDDWLALLTILENDKSLSPRWYQIALTAPLFSPLLNEILPRIEPCLFEKDSLLLAKLLNALRIICVQPHPTAHLVFWGLPQSEVEKYLAYWTIPVWEQWIPVIQLILKNSSMLSDDAIREFSHIAEKWMTTTEGNQLFRKEIARLSFDLWNAHLKYKHSNFVKSVLWAADCLPDMVEAFVREKVLRDNENRNYDIEELILKEGWAPLCKYLPRVTVEVMEKIRHVSNFLKN
jgi:hypothetical protein